MLSLNTVFHWRYAEYSALPETWYAIVDANGQLVSVGTVVANPLPQGLTQIPFANRPDQDPVIWDAKAQTFVPNAIATKPDPVQAKLDAIAAHLGVDVSAIGDAQALTP